jgi:hypothetical protein
LLADVTDDTRAAGTAFFDIVRDVVGAFAVVGEQTLLAARALLVLRGTFATKDGKADFGGRSPEYRTLHRKLMELAVPDEAQRARVESSVRKRIAEASKADAARGWAKLTVPSRESKGGGGSTAPKAPSAKQVQHAAMTMERLGQTLTVNQSDGDPVVPIVPLSAALASLRYCEKMLAAQSGGADAKVKLAAAQCAEVAISIVHLAGNGKALTKALEHGKARSITKRNED